MLQGHNTIELEPLLYVLKFQLVLFQDWSTQARKGFVVVEDGGKFSSHCYKLKVPSSSKLWLTIHGNFQGEFDAASVMCKH